MGQQIASHFAEGVGRIVAYLPHLVSGIILLVVGYMLARLLGGLTHRLLGRTSFDRWVARHVDPRSARRETRPSQALGSAIFWLGMLVTCALAADALHLHAVAAGLKGILGYVPNVLVAAIILAVGIAVANMLANLIGDMTSDWAAKAARVAVMVLAMFMALDQLGVAKNIVMTAFALMLGAAAVAAAIAFGVGNRQLAGDLTRRFMNRREEQSDLEPPPLEPTEPTPRDLDLRERH